MTERIFSLDWKHGWETCDGRPVRLVCTNRRGSHPLLGLVDHGIDELAAGWRIDGCAFSDASPSMLDLRNRPAPKVKKKVWVNMFRDERGIFPAWPTYATAEAAAIAARDMAACVGTICGEIELPTEDGNG